MEETMTILVDDRGRPLERPTRPDFQNDVDYVRAIHEHNQRVTNAANVAFGDAFTRAIRKAR